MSQLMITDAFAQAKRHISVKTPPSVLLTLMYDRLATDCLFKNSGAATKSRVVSTTNSNSMRSIKTAH